MRSKKSYTPTMPLLLFMRHEDMQPRNQKKWQNGHSFCTKGQFGRRRLQLCILNVFCLSTYVFAYVTEIKSTYLLTYYTCATVKKNSLYHILYHTCATLCTIHTHMWLMLYHKWKELTCTTFYTIHVPHFVMLMISDVMPHLKLLLMRDVTMSSPCCSTGPVVYLRLFGH